jgi:hypothetical protein
VVGVGFPPAVIRISERDNYLMVLREADQGNLDGVIEFIAEHVVGSLDVYLRALAGEEIHEPIDIEKEIALLEVELRAVEEPRRLTTAIQRELFNNSINPLFREIVRLLTPLCKFFSDNRITLGGTIGGENTEQGISDRTPRGIEGAPAVPLPEGWGWAGSTTIHRLDLDFHLSGFKKGKFETRSRDAPTKLRAAEVYGIYALSERATQSPAFLSRIAEDRRNP